MPDQTIDAIKVRLGLDTSDVHSKVEAANQELDALGKGKARVVKVHVQALFQEGGSAALNRLERLGKQGLKIPISVDFKTTGGSSVASMRTKINKALSEAGGVSVPVKIAINEQQARGLRNSVQRALNGAGPVDVYFNWVAKNKPTYSGPPIVVPWTFGPGPGGATGPAGGGAPPSGGGGGGAAPAAGGGRSRSHARTATTAAQAEERADKETEKTARTKERVAKEQQQEQQQARTQGTATGSAASGPAARTTRAARSVANKQAHATAQAETRAEREAEKAAKLKEKAAKEQQRSATGGTAATPPPPPSAGPTAPKPPASPKPPRGGLSGAGTRAPAARSAPATAPTSVAPATSADTAERLSTDQLRAGGGPASRESGYRVSGNPRNRMNVPPGMDLPGDELQPDVRAERMDRRRREHEEAAQQRRRDELVKQVRSMKEQGFDPLDPKARREYVQGLPAAERRRFNRQFRHTLDSSKRDFNSDDPDVLAGFLGSAEAAGQSWQTAVDVSEGRVSERLAGARYSGRKGGTDPIWTGGEIRDRGKPDEKGTISTEHASRGSRAKVRIMRPAEVTRAQDELIKARTGSVIPRTQRSSGSGIHPSTAHIAEEHAGYDTLNKRLAAKDQAEADRRAAQRARENAYYTMENAPEAVRSQLEGPLASGKIPKDALPDVLRRAMGAIPDDFMKLADGGLNPYSRPFGKSYVEGEREREHPAKANLYDWKKRANAQKRAQPWCSYCGMGKGEAKRSGSRLEAGHIIPAHAGGTDEPGNLTTLCRSCNAAEGGEGGTFPKEDWWTEPRRPQVASHPKIKGKREDFLPGGPLFRVIGVQEALKKIKGLAEGGISFSGGKTPYGSATEQYDKRIKELPFDKDAFLHPGPISRSAAVKMLKRARMAEEGEEFYPDVMRMSGKAEGGYVRHGGLLERMASAGAQPLVTMKGERGPELDVTDPNTGETETVPTHKVPTWLARARDPRGMGATMSRGKDLTHAAEGNRMSGPAGLRMRGGGRGTFAQQQSMAAAAAVAGGTAQQAGVTQVAVINWPPALLNPMAAPAVGNPNVPAGPGVNPINAAGPIVNQAAAAGAAAAAKLGVGGAGGPAAGGPPIAKLGPATPGGASGKSRMWRRQEELTDISAKVAETKQMTPARAFTTSVAQIAENITGRTEIAKRGKHAEKLLSQANAALLGEQTARNDLAKDIKRERNLRKNYMGSFSAQGPIDFRGNKGEEAEFGKIMGRRGEYEARVGNAKQTALVKADQAKAASLDILRPGDVMKNLFSGFIGLTGATIAMKAAFSVINMGMETLATEAGKVADRLTGYRQTTVDLTRTVGDQIRANSGNTTAALASATALSGLGGEVSAAIRPILAQRALMEAGNKAMSEQVSLINASVRSQGDQQIALAGGAIGPLQPRGGIPGVTAGTGGFLGTPIGQQAPLFEQLSQAAGFSPIDQVLRGIGNAVSPSIPGTPSTQTNQQGNILTPEQVQARLDQGRTQEAANADFRSRQANGGLTLPEVVAGPFYADDRAAGKATEAANADVQRSQAVNLALKDFAGNLDKTNGKFTQLRKGMDGWTQEIQDASLVTLKASGASEDQLAVLKQTNTAYVNRQTGQAIQTPSEVAQLGQQFYQGAVTPSMRDLVDQLRGGNGRMGTAEIAQRAIRREGVYERDSLIPAQTALRFAAQPQVPYGDPRQRPSQNVLNAPGSQAGFEKQSAAYEKAFQKYTKYAIPAQTQINDLITEGGKQLADTFHVPQRLMDDISGLGRSIQDVQLGIQQRGLNLQVAEYNNQLRIAKRSLRDARDFQAGIAGATRDTLGGLEGQNALLSRQLQLLGLELEQRQINFKLAMAGFTAPGDTPEQRQARIEQAKIEASYAQKQLDINKQMSSNQWRGVSITASRSVTDLVAQVGLLRQGISLTIDSSQADAATKKMTDALNANMAMAESYFSEGQKQAKFAMDFITEAESRTGQAISNIADEVTGVFVEAGNQAATNIIKMLSLVSAYGASSGGTSGMSDAQIIKLEKKYHEDLNGNGRIGASEGFLGTVNTPTNFTAGEVNGETVVVLKNPKSIAPGGMGSGGGTVNVNINIAGGGDIDEKKLASWGKQIQRETIAALNRQTSLLGLRTP